jgi:hypothetical protein
VLFAVISLSAQQTYLKYEFMKVLPGQDYEKLEKSWVNYHKELMNAGIINMHRVWKVLPGSNVDYDYIVSTSYNSYADALGIGKKISTDDFKAKYPEDFKIMLGTTAETRTMVRTAILKVELGISEPSSPVVPNKSILNMIFIKDKNDNYGAAEIKFSKKWHQFLIDKKIKDGFYFSSVVGSRGVDTDFSYVISHIFKNIDQYTEASNFNGYNMTANDQAELTKLRSYRDLKTSLMLLNVMNLEK